MKRGELTIDLGAVQRNFLSLKKHLPSGCQITPVIKANGYGLGAKEIASCLAPFTPPFLTVVSLEEAEEIYPQKALVLHADKSEFFALSNLLASVVITDLNQLRFLKKEKIPLNLHLHLDTGMHRLGIGLNEIEEAASLLLASPHLVLEGVMTHFAASESPEEDNFSRKQIDILLFAKALLSSRGLTPLFTHAANSFGAIRFSNLGFNLARVGLALYGMRNGDFPLEAAVTLTSFITQIHNLEEGESAGYGRTFVAKRKSRIAAVPLGYYDGVPRSLSNRGSVHIEGKKAQIVGAVSMDFFLVDVTEIESAAPLTPVTLFGKEHAIEELAKSGHTIPHELLSRIGPRVLRRFEKTLSFATQLRENLAIEEILR